MPSPTHLLGDLADSARARVLPLLSPRNRARWGADSLSRDGQAVVDRRRQETREERLERTKQSIAERLAPVCVQMPGEEFDALVAHMAELQIRYALRRSEDLFPEMAAESRRASIEVA
jgi:hypothetical protein